MSQSNVMSIAKLGNKVSREAFDISRRTCFTAKVGELLPTRVVEMCPNDVIEIKPSWFTRTQPVNTAAYTRVTEYYDFFFVPTNLLWNRFNSFVMQMGDNLQTATAINKNDKVGNVHPYFELAYLNKAVSNSLKKDEFLPFSKTNINLDVCGLSRCVQSFKLLHYLGYGAVDGNGLVSTLNVNPFPLLAYQKIYSDWYRDQQWEIADPSTFNINYIPDGSAIPVDDIDLTKDSMLTLRYANFKKDLFMGVLPQAQYGDAAVGFVWGNVNPVRIQSNVGTQLDKDGDTVKLWKATGDKYNYLGASDKTVLYYASDQIIGDITTLEMRRAQASQKWKEITQSNQKDYKHQVKAHFDKDVSDAYSEHVMWLGGTKDVLDIGEVVNTNLNGTEDNFSANSASISGKGVGSGMGEELKFTAPCHGIFMVIYHAIPLLDYANNGIEPLNLKTHVTDYAIPEFDKTGMIPVPLVNLVSPLLADDWEGNYKPETPIGYAPQYYDYKVTYDNVLGAFVYGGLNSWVAPLDSNYFFTKFKANNFKMDYSFFKVNPQIMNPIFALDAFQPIPDNTDNYDIFLAQLGNDQLLVNQFLDTKVVRSLDRNGLPY